MWRFVLRRLGFFVFTLFITSAIIFMLTRVLPGDVARVLLGREATEEAIEAKREELGLNDPLVVQYVNWARDFIQGDWGTMFSRESESIREVVMLRAARSGQLAALTLMISVPLSILLGVVAGLTEGRWTDSVISVFSLSVVSMPEFVTGFFLIMVVSPLVGLPASSTSIRPDTPFLEALPYMWLPAICATLVLLAYIVRLTRAGVIEELKRDYVRTAMLKGLPYRTVIGKHVLRNALIPTVTVIANSTGWLISGMVIIEVVFSYPGVGRLLIYGIETRDLPLIQAVVMVTVMVILVANFLADILYAVLNPRISLS